MAVLLRNNAVSRLASSLTAAATTLSVTSGEGARFPSPTGGDWFPLTIVKASGALEIVRCTARSGDVFTVTRAQESTAAQSFAAGDRVELRLTQAVIADIIQQIADLSSAALLDTNNLSDLTSAATARSNLGLGSAATKAAQTAANDATSGSLMVVGAFGLGEQAIVVVTDPDVVRPLQFFRMVGSAAGNPFGATGCTILTVPDGTTYGWQLAFPNGGSASPKYRVRASSTTWGAWKTFFDTGNISAFAQTLLNDANQAEAMATLGISVADGGLGYGQSWSDVTASRALSTTYTNTTGKPIFVTIVTGSNATTVTIDGISLPTTEPVNSLKYVWQFIVPPNGTYRVTSSNPLEKWLELR